MPDMRGLRVAILPADSGACGHYRLMWPADAVRKARPDWEITVYDPSTVKVERTTSGMRIHGLPWRDIDVIVTQRVGSPVVADMAEWLQAHGVAVVLDMDDAMWALDPSNTAYAAWNGDPDRLHWSMIDQVAGIADMVTVTTSVLAGRYGGHGRVEILPNRIPRMALNARQSVAARRRPVVGWSGLLATHPHDPSVVGDAVKRAYVTGRVSVAAMGDTYRTGKLWGVRALEIKTASLGPAYYRQLAGFDIGLVPLDLSGTSAVFNSGKSSLKALEMAATGSAVIASPSPANVEFAREVPIRLAETPDEWLRHMVELADPMVRGEQVSKQSAAIRAGWVLQDRAEDWATAWEQAVNNRRNA